MNPKVLLIAGSPTSGSHTRAVLEALSARLVAFGAVPSLLDLALVSLPRCDPRFHSDPSEHPDPAVGAFAERVRSADAIVLGTPLYHGSYSGVLKDALDLLASDGFDDKPVGLVSHGAGIRACTLPCEHMRAIVRAMGGVSTQSQIGTTKSDFESNAEGTRTLVNPDILARVETMARELIALSYGMAAKRIAERKLG